MGITNWSWKNTQRRFCELPSLKKTVTKIRTQNAQKRREKIWTHNDIQRLLGGISCLSPAVRIIPDLIVHLNKILVGAKDLNSPKWLIAEAEKKLTLIEEKL